MYSCIRVLMNSYIHVFMYSRIHVLMYLIYSRIHVFVLCSCVRIIIIVAFQIIALQCISCMRKRYLLLTVWCGVVCGCMCVIKGYLNNLKCSHFLKHIIKFQQ